MRETTSTYTEPTAFRDIFTVSRLNRAVRDILDVSFPLIWVEGEISNLARPSSGHMYFSLKDEQAQVRCAMFRMRNRHLDFTPENGMHVLARAQISLYEARGDYQLIVEHMEEAGDGALRRAFEALKKRLADEGLFDASRKRPIPALPRCIGVVTSPTGAAIRDILSVLKRRFPGIPVLIYPVPVQGLEAAREIARMIDIVSKRKDCDVVILARGGGSLEDLWAFNEEVVARAISGCEVPVVTGIGHEIDFTIADFVADQRAATPSAAAELITPAGDELFQTLVKLELRLTHLINQKIHHLNQNLVWLGKRLQHPGQRLLAQAQRVDELEQRLRIAHRSLLRHLTHQLQTLTARLQQHTPTHRLKNMITWRENLTGRLVTAMGHQLKTRQHRLAAIVRALETVSPLATLGRGYAIVRRLPERKLLYSYQDVSPGDQVEARLAEGLLTCRVESTHEE
jgi:exodeoxyribonuclease VII large subunit